MEQRLDRTEIFVRRCQITITKRNNRYIDERIHHSGGRDLHDWESIRFRAGPIRAGAAQHFHFHMGDRACLHEEGKHMDQLINMGANCTLWVKQITQKKNILTKIIEEVEK